MYCSILGLFLVFQPFSRFPRSSAMATSDSINDALQHSITDEKQEQLQREYVAQENGLEVLENKKREDALTRKLDCFVAPVMMMLMLISYLDRGNIGFAATQGMNTDIDLKGSELNVRRDVVCTSLMAH